MDDFLGLYVVLAIAAVIFNVLFWGGLIYLVIRFVSGGKTPQARQQRMGLVATMLNSRSGHSSSGEGPVTSSIRGMAAREGIDLDRP